MRKLKNKKAAYPLNLEREYMRLLDDALEIYWAEILKSLSTVLRFDSLVSDIFDSLRSRWGSIVSTLAPQIRNIGKRVDQFDYVKLQENMGVSLARGFLPFGEHTAILDSFVEQNVSLIRDLGSRFNEQISYKVTEAVSKGIRGKELSKYLQETYSVTKSRADLIAVDQIGKLNGAIAKARQTETGVTHYTWQTVGDNRVRPAHAARDGKVFAWDEPPSDGHPGEPVRCRCSAVPVLDYQFTPEQQTAEDKDEQARKARLAKQLAQIEALNK